MGAGAELESSSGSGQVGQEIRVNGHVLEELGRLAFIAHKPEGPDFHVVSLVFPRREVLPSRRVIL